MKNFDLVKNHRNSYDFHWFGTTLSSLGQSEINENHRKFNDFSLNQKFSWTKKIYKVWIFVSELIWWKASLWPIFLLGKSGVAILTPHSRFYLTRPHLPRSDTESDARTDSPIVRSDRSGCRWLSPPGSARAPAPLRRLLLRRAQVRCSFGDMGVQTNHQSFRLRHGRR